MLLSRRMFGRYMAVNTRSRCVLSSSAFFSSGKRATAVSSIDIGAALAAAKNLRKTDPTTSVSGLTGIKKKGPPPFSLGGNKTRLSLLTKPLAGKTPAGSLSDLFGSTKQTNNGKSSPGGDVFSSTMGRASPTLDFQQALEKVSSFRSKHEAQALETSKQKLKKMELHRWVVDYQQKHAHERSPMRLMSPKLVGVLTGEDIESESLARMNALLLDLHEDVDTATREKKHKANLLEEDPLLQSFRKAIGMSPSTAARMSLPIDVSPMQMNHTHDIHSLGFGHAVAAEVDEEVGEVVVDDWLSGTNCTFAEPEEMEHFQRRQLRQTSEVKVAIDDMAMTAIQLARAARKPVEDVLEELNKQWSVPATAHTLISADDVELYLENHGIDLDREEVMDARATFKKDSELVVDYLSWPRRPPLICVMGHVDHGKTTLIDTLRNSSLAAKEVGKITQTIGAFQVRFGGNELATFMDTPGHAAFKGMREFGANATDIVVLVVSAVESVKPQTIESIQHALQVDIPVVVAVNKMDLSGASLDKVQDDLLKHGIQTEKYGGDVMAVGISALKGTGLDELGEAIMLTADMLELRAPQDVPAEAIVIESKACKKRGPVTSLIVAKGTLRVGDFFVSGTEWGRVRAIEDCRGAAVTEATPGTPVTVTGLRGIDGSAADLVVVKDFDTVQEVIENRVRSGDIAMREEILPDMDEGNPLAKIARRIRILNEQLGRTHVSLKKRVRMTERKISNLYAEGQYIAESLGLEDGDTQQLDDALEHEHDPHAPAMEKIVEADPTVLNVYVKADVRGSLMALLDYFHSLPRDEIKVNVVGAGLGPMSMAEVLKAKAAGCHVISFNCPTSGEVADLLDREHIKYADHSLIYNLFDDFEDATLGTANVLKCFTLHGKRRNVSSLVAGCVVKSGQVKSDARVRVLRGGEAVYSDLKVASLRQDGDSVRLLDKGAECGIVLEDHMDLHPHDQLEFYEEVRTERQFDDSNGRNLGSLSDLDHREAYN